MDSFCSMRLMAALVSFKPVPRKRVGMTIVELLVVIAIIGVLMGLLLPAIQQSREAARRAQCCNHMKNLALGLHNFEEARGHLPPGCSAYLTWNHSWFTQILPYLEQANVREQMDLTKPWWDPQRNWAISGTVIPIFRCPSSLLDEPGDTDYGGITGSAASPKASSETIATNGCLIFRLEVNAPGVAFSDITDGLSQTVLVAESADRPASWNGRWANGLGIFIVNHGVGTFGEIYSQHPGGANVAMADGSVHFLSQTLDEAVVGALCSRNESD